ncbi:MAG: FHA domain-containing protein [Anaerolineales bacterium]|nr:FHA domain-containing protein [Anaerolineales bacterium]
MLIPDKAAPRQTETCQELESELPKGSIAFVGSTSGPLIINSVSNVTIGRGDVDTVDSFVDMSYFGELAQAISRQHARVIYQDGVFTLEDLNSTNGTWLNHQRLPPGTPFPLDTGDRLWLGPLKLSICLGRKIITAAHKPMPVPSSDTLTLTADLFLQFRQSTATGRHPLTPVVLSQHVAPYLESVAALQQVLQAWRQQAQPEPRIRSINTQGTLIIVRMTDAIEPVDILYRLVAPWQAAHWQADSVVEDQPPVSQQPLNLARLAETIVRDQVPHVTEEKLSAFMKRLLPVLRSIALSQLELMPPASLGITTTLDSQRAD